MVCFYYRKVIRIIKQVFANTNFDIAVYYVKWGELFNERKQVLPNSSYA